MRVEGRRALRQLVLIAALATACRSVCDDEASACNGWLSIVFACRPDFSLFDGTDGGYGIFHWRPMLWADVISFSPREFRAAPWPVFTDSVILMAGGLIIGSLASAIGAPWPRADDASPHVIHVRSLLV